MTCFYCNVDCDIFQYINWRWALRECFYQYVCPKLGFRKRFQTLTNIVYLQLHAGQEMPIYVENEFVIGQHLKQSRRKVVTPPRKKIVQIIPFNSICLLPQAILTTLLTRMQYLVFHGETVCCLILIHWQIY